jgi:YaiO family outer membrane protein
MKLAVPALALFLSALALGAPARAQTAEEDYRAGVAARLAGHSLEALVRLTRAAEAEPVNADVRLQIAFAYLAEGLLDQAESAFKKTLELAPEYADARFGLALVAQRRDNSHAALADLAAIAPGHVEADALRQLLEAQIAVSARRWRVDLDGGYSQISGQPDWQSTSLGIQHQVGGSITAAASVEWTRRFERSDTYGEGRVDYRFSPGGNVYLLFGGTPGADHRPTCQLGTGVAARIHAGPYATVLRLDLRQADYPAGAVQTVTPGIEQYLTGRAWITAQWINVWDSSRHESGWLVRGDFMPTARLRLFAGAARAPDLEQGTVIYTSSLFGGLSIDVNARLTLRASLAHDNPAASPGRTSAALGIGYRF